MLTIIVYTSSFNRISNSKDPWRLKNNCGFVSWRMESDQECILRIASFRDSPLISKRTFLEETVPSGCDLTLKRITIFLPRFCILSNISASSDVIVSAGILEPEIIFEPFKVTVCCAKQFPHIFSQEKCNLCLFRDFKCIYIRKTISRLWLLMESCAKACLIYAINFHEKPLCSMNSIFNFSRNDFILFCISFQKIQRL